MKKIKTELKWALLYVAMTIAWALIAKLAGFHGSRIEYNLLFNSLVIIPSFIIYLLALREKRQRSYHGYMSYKQGVISGLLLTLFLTIFGPLTPLVSIGIFSPDFFSNAIQYSVSTGMMSEADAISQFNMSAFIVQSVMAAPVFGIFLTLITAAITRKRYKSMAEPHAS